VSLLNRNSAPAFPLSSGKGALFALFFLLPGCAGDSPTHVKRTFMRMDTVVEVTLVRHRHTRDEIRCVWEAVDSTLKDWEMRFSQTNLKSEVLVLNQRTDSVVKVSGELARMLHDARRYCDTLGGTLDFTLLPIKELWGFGEQGGPERVPPQDSIRLMLRNVDYRKVAVDTLRRIVHISDPAIRVDVGGVGKGYIFKRIGALLEQRGFPDFLIVEGGDIFCKGTRGDRQPWRIGVQHPRKSDRLLAQLPLDSGALVTSGDYERFFMKDGRRYCHLFDPRTGESCERNQSLTLWAMDPVELDNLSTGMFCWDPDSILAFVERRPRLQCLVVDSSGRLLISSGWKSRIHLNE